MKIRIFENINGTEYESTWLPQMRADYDYIHKGLEDNGVNFTVSSEDPNELYPLKSSGKDDEESVNFFKDKIAKREPIDPIFVSKNNEILDGRKRHTAFKDDPSVKKIVCIKLMMDYKDAARILNKIQDKFEFEQNLNTGNPEAIKPLDDNGEVYPSTSDNTDTVDENLIEKPSDINTNTKKFTLYRSKPIQNNSKNGNFFLMDHQPRFDHQYDIEFHNLYEIPDEELGTDMFNTLAEKWLGNLDQLKEQSVKNALTYETYLNRRIHEEAKKKGFDGIKYGSKLIQSIKH